MSNDYEKLGPILGAMTEGIVERGFLLDTETNLSTFLNWVKENENGVWNTIVGPALDEIEELFRRKLEKEDDDA